ncbi:hypothetical protein [Actinokineospora inagensis]|uniref:hypothetical protein n=1 Tax=Actinokineospora inagensis TaxID=103730 RepID=UPI00041E004F|nr:hypothetical protein [Actinokineospora inagensis]
MSRPLEIRVAALILTAVAVLFFVTGLTRGDARSLVFPAVLGVITLLAAVSAYVGRYVGVALIVSALAAIAHAAIALSDLTVWLRIASGVFAAGYVYAGVLLLTRPARKFSGKEPGDES